MWIKVAACAALAWAFFAALAEGGGTMPATQPHWTTVVSIKDGGFEINGRPTYAGRTWKGRKIEGLLMNARLVQGIFDDSNEETRGRWTYPDGAWDPDRNTREFVAAMPAWRKAGLLSFTINLQGGSPEGYSKTQPWVNSAFEADGSLKAAYMRRLELILDKADELGMAPMVGFFYNRQAARMKDEAAVIRATENATDWLVGKGYTHVLVEIANESDIEGFGHAIINTDRIVELMKLVKERSQGKVKNAAGRLLVSDSYTGGKLMSAAIVEASDFVLLHGNGVGNPKKITEMVEKTRKMKAYRGQPIVFNEDDHFQFDKDENNFVAAVSAGASWGYFDYRMKGEGFDEGFQSVPVNWGMSSERKRGFFGLLAEMTGGEVAGRGK